MESAVLVERDRKAQSIIRENIGMTKEADKFQLLAMEANQALGQLTGSFDVVFLDPPYAKEEIMDNIQQLCQRKLLAEDVMVV